MLGTAYLIRYGQDQNREKQIVVKSENYFNECGQTKVCNKSTFPPLSDNLELKDDPCFWGSQDVLK